jgi:hypothetical protein
LENKIQQERLQAYLDAEKKALVSQEYQEGTKRTRRASLDQIGDGINSLLATGPVSGRSRRVILRD